MKILFIDFTLPYLIADAVYPIGGWAVQLNAWVKGLSANGQQVGVLTWKGANRFVNQRLDFDLIETYNPAKGIKIFKYFYSYIPVLYQKAYQYNPDVIIQACSGLNTGIMAFIAKRLKVPFIHRIASNIDADNGYKHNLLKYEQIAYAYGLKKASVILCQNTYQYESLKIKFPVKQINIIPNPFSPSSFETSLRPYKDRTYIAWLGVFKKPKNVPLLHDIARKLPEIKFKIAGMPGNGIDSATEKALASLSQLPNVEFVGYLPNEHVVSFLSRAVALLNTSHYEGFSNTFLEAFFAGTPVIAPMHADPDLIIQKHGLGASVKTSSDFPSHIKYLWEGKNQFGEISLKCRTYLYKHHDPQGAARRLIDIVAKLKRGI